MKKLNFFLFLVLITPLILFGQEGSEFDKFRSTPGVIITQEEYSVGAYKSNPLPYTVKLIKLTKANESKLFVQISIMQLGKSSNSYNGYIPLTEFKQAYSQLSSLMEVMNSSPTNRIQKIFTTLSGFSLEFINSGPPDFNKYIYVYVDNKRTYYPIELLKDFETIKTMFDDTIKIANSL